MERMLDQSRCGCFLGSRLAKSDDDKVTMQCDFSMGQNPFHTSRIKILTPKIIHTLYQKCWHKGEYILAHPSCSEPSHPGNWGSRAAFLPRSTPPLWIHHPEASNFIKFHYRYLTFICTEGDLRLPTTYDNHPSNPFTYSCEDDLSIEDLI